MNFVLALTYFLLELMGKRSFTTSATAFLRIAQPVNVLQKVGPSIQANKTECTLYAIEPCAKRSMVE